MRPGSLVPITLTAAIVLVARRGAPGLGSDIDNRLRLS